MLPEGNKGLLNIFIKFVSEMTCFSYGKKVGKRI